MDRKVFDSINLQLKEKDRIIIAIEGSCASGKTTFSEEINNNFDCNVIHMDDFFLPFEMRTEERFSEIGGNIDYERFHKEIVLNLKKDTPFSYGKFDCSTGKINKKIEFMPKQLTVVEGVYSMHPKFGEVYDLKIFLDITDETKINRLRIRSPEKLERFINEWIPKENKYFDHFKIKDKCDLIIDNN